MSVVEPATLGLFVGAVLLLLMSPGPNMAFVIAHGVSYGWRGSVAASLGIGLADLVLTTLTALGITAVIAQGPLAFDLIRLVGALYLLWMARKVWSNPSVLTTQARKQRALFSVMLRSMLNSLLNPKALLFFMVFLPQFVNAAKGQVPQQLMMLGVLLTMVSFVFHSVLGALGTVVNRWLAGNTQAARWQSRTLALVLALLALRLALMTRPS